MLERDSEQLAIEQLTPAGRADEIELRRAAHVSNEPHQERAATAGERREQHLGRSELEAMRERLEQLRAQRSALPVRGLTQLEDAHACLIELQRGRDRAAAALDDLPPPRPRRLGRSHDPSEAQRTHLTATLATYERELEAARARCATLERQLGDPEQIRSERDGLDRAIGRLGAEIRELSGRLVEQELDGHDETGRPRPAFERDQHRTLARDLGLEL
jgi:hypothetical protein